MKTQKQMSGKFAKRVLVLTAVVVSGLLGVMLPLAQGAVSVDNQVLYDFENQGSSPTVFDTTPSADNGLFSNPLATGNGLPVFSTAQAYEGSGSALFANGGGSTFGQAITINNTLDLTADFKLSMAIYPTAYPVPGAISFLYSLGGAANAANSGDIFLSILNNGGANQILYYNHGGGLNLQVTGGHVLLNQWQTVAMVRSNNYVTFYLDGVQLNTPTLDTAITASNFQSYLGYAGFGGGIESGYYGYIDAFDFNVVPEPSTAMLLGLGGLFVLRRHRKK